MPEEPSSRSRAPGRLLRAGLREPLAQFLALGLLLLAAQRVHRAIAPQPSERADPGDPAARAALIEIGRDEVRGVRADLVRRLGRVPEAAELAAALSRLVDDEVLLREARRRGLDQGDVIVRRRLIQKMELLAEAMAPAAPPPDDEQLRALRDRQPERFREPARMTLEHVFVSRDRHGARTGAVAESLRRRLAAGEPAAALGQPFPRGRSFGPLSETQLSGIFGAELAAAAMGLPQGVWSAPLSSAYGLHLVRVSVQLAPRLPDVAELRERLTEEWHASRREERQRRAIEALRSRYRVLIAAPERDQE